MTDAEVIASVLASDLASEVSREVSEHLSFGVDMPAITQRIAADFSDALADPHHGPVVILALAAVQAREQQLHAVIRDAALLLIDSGEAGKAFARDQTDLRVQRQQLLERFAQLLLDSPVTESE